MPDDRLSRLLRMAGRLTLGAEIARAACGALGVLLAAALSALAIDALLGLYPWGLVALDLLLLVLLLCAAGYVARQTWRNLFDPRRVARQLELRRGLHGSELINSVDLADEPRRSGSPQLVDETIQHGEELAARLSPADAVDFRRPLKASAAAAAVMFVIFVSYLAVPRVFAMVLPRLFDPTGDHPPYTLLTFAITVSPDPVYEGRPATISARLSGPEAVDDANLVFVDGRERLRLPMFRDSEGTFILPIERAETAREFFIDTPKGRSIRHMFSVLHVPCFEKADVVYRFPKYTGWPSTGHPLDSRGIQALDGTEIVVSATANMPLRSGRLELYDQDEKQAAAGGGGPRIVTLEPDAKEVNTVSGRFTLTSSGRFRLGLVGINEVEGPERREGIIVCVPDRPPQVAFLSPEPHVAAVEGWKVPVEVQAIDDVGIDRIMLFAGVNGWGPDSMRLTLETPQPNVARGRHEFDLGGLGARAGDIISYYASAYDNHPSGKQFTDTPIQVIQVISLEEFTQFAREKYQMEQWAEELDAFRQRLDDLKAKRQRLLEESAELRKKLDAGKKLSSDEVAKLTEQQARLTEYAEEAQKLAKDMRERAKQQQLYEMEPAYRDMLQQLGKQLDEQAAGARQLARQVGQLQKLPAGPQSANAFRGAAKTFGQLEKPFDAASEKQVETSRQDLEKMRQADALIASGERLRAAILEQRELAERTAQFRARKKLTEDEKARLDRFAKEQELLREEVDEARAELAKTAEAAKKLLPKMSGQALKICHAIEEMRVSDDQAQAARSARAGEAEAAHQGAESAAKKLESLLSQCCSPKNAMQSGDLDGCFKLPKPSLGQSLQQLAQGRKPFGFGKQGSQGAGEAGSRTRMAVFGPHQLSQGESDASRSGGSARQGRGARANGQQDESARPAELLDAGARPSSHSAVGNLHGVPVGFRDQAEAYFKRIAKEQ